MLIDALDGLARVAPPPPPPPETIRRTVLLTDRAQRIRRALRGADVVVLQDLLKGVRDRVVVAVTFLAMLELDEAARDRRRAGGAVGTDLARRTTPEERAVAGVPAIDEEAPLDESLESFA